MVDNPDLLILFSTDGWHTLILERNIIEIRLVPIPRNLFSFFVPFWLTRQLGNLKAHNGLQWFNYVFSISVNLWTFWCRWLCFFLWILRISCWFRVCVKYRWGGVGSRRKLDLLNPCWKFLGTDVTNLRVECIQIPEALIDQIENIRVKIQSMLVILNQTKHRGSQEAW